MKDCPKFKRLQAVSVQDSKRWRIYWHKIIRAKILLLESDTSMFNKIVVSDSCLYQRFFLAAAVVLHYRVYREPLTAGGHVTSHVWGLRYAFSTGGKRLSRMLFTWKLLAYNSCLIPRNDTKILWSKSLSINRGTNSGEMLNLINPIGSWKQAPFMAADSKWRP